MLTDGAISHSTLAAALDGKFSAGVVLAAIYPATETDTFRATFADSLSEALAIASDVLVYEPGKAAHCHFIVIPAGIRQPVPESLFRLEWASNIYVAPEDRRVASAPNVLAEDEADFPAHAAHAVVALCSLWSADVAWSGGDAGPSRLSGGRLAAVQAHQANSSAGVTVAVSRSFSRVADLGTLPSDLAHRVFIPDGDWPSPDLERFERLTSTSADALIADLAQRYWRKHAGALDVTPFEPLVPDIQTFRDWRAALKYLWKVAIEWVTRAPMRYFNQKRAIAEGWANEKVLAAIAKVDLDPRKKAIADGLLVSNAGDEHVTSDYAEYGLIVADPPVGEVWDDLYRTAFAITDGGEVPAGVGEHAILTRQSGGTERRVVVTDPSAVAPDPRTAAPTKPPAEQADPLVAGPPTAEPEWDAAAAVVFDVLADGIPETAPVGDQESFVSRVGARITSAIRRAEEEAANRPAAATVGEPAEETLHEATEPTPEAQSPARGFLARIGHGVLRFIKAFLVFWVGVVLMLIGVLVGGTALLALPIGIVLMVVGVLIPPICFAIMAIRTLLREREGALEDRYAELNSKLLSDVRRRDLLRLRRRQVEFTDWAEIIGWLVHHPWTTVVDSSDAATDADHSTVPFPAACGVAHRAPGPLSDTLVDHARSATFAQGWLLTTYVEAARTMIGARYTPPKTSNAEGDSTARELLAMAAADTSEDPESPRRVLLNALRSDRRNITLTPSLVRRFLDYIAREQIDAVAGPLDAGPTGGSSDAAVTGGATSNERNGVSVETFFNELDTRSEATAFLIQHWVAAERDENLIAKTVPAFREESLTRASLGKWGITPVLDGPLRVALSRVDFSREVAPDELASCAAAAPADDAATRVIPETGLPLLGIPGDEG